MNTSRTPTVIRIALFLSICATTLLAQAPYASSRRAFEHPASQARKSRYIRMATAIGDDYFDGTDSALRVRRHMRVARATGVRYLRCAFSWNGIEPERGHYRFAFWDMLVTEAARAGVTLIPYVAYTPRWAAGTESEYWKQPPADPDDYAAVMRTLAARYRGRIRHWELWNEPDNREYWAGSVDQFEATVIAAAQAVKAVAPEDKLVLGGMTLGVGDFKTLVSKHHLERYVNVVALHAYPESWNEERAETAFGARTDEMHQIAEHSGRELWLNEMGYADYRFQPNKASIWGTSAYYSYEHTPRYAADFLFKSFVMTLASGHVALAGWYRIDDFRENDPRMPADKVNHHLGIIDGQGRPKPTYFALRFVNLLFSTPVRPVPYRTKSGSQAVVRVFRRKGGSLVIAGWLRSSNYSEVPIHSGTLRDERSERVDIPLPCTASRITTFNSLGERLSRGHRPRRVLRQVRLTGDKIYVAEVACSTYSSRKRPR